MKQIKWILMIPGFVLLMTTCKKNEDIPKINELPPEPTPKGTETGIPSIASIGTDGGSVISADGKLELIFPGGALSSVTGISVQTVTNNAPGGIGNAYRFGPEGTPLNMPVTLKFQYTDGDVAGSLPRFLGMAVQDTDQVWYSLRNPVLDTVNKTISFTSKKLFASDSKSAKHKGVETSDFPDYAVFLDLFILPKIAYLNVQESKEFRVYAVGNHVSSETGNGDEDDLPHLPGAHEISEDNIEQWTVNGIPYGNAVYGAVIPYDAACTYTAPGSMPPSIPVILAAEIRLWYDNPESGREHDNLRLMAPITIIDEHQYYYSLKLEFKDESWPAYFSWMYTDNATMDVAVIDYIVSVDNIQNVNANVSPLTQVNESGVETCTGEWQFVANATGHLNINEASGTVSYDPGDEDILLLLNIKSVGAVTPKFTYECTRSGSTETGGNVLAPQQYNFRFILNNQAQTQYGMGGVTAILTPVNPP